MKIRHLQQEFSVAPVRYLVTLRIPLITPLESGTATLFRCKAPWDSG